VLRPLRTYFAFRPDPYAGGDLGNAQRIGSFFFALQALLLLALLPLSPPTEAIGPGGWIIAGAIILIAIVVTLAMRAWRFGSWNGLLVAACGALAALEVMQWLGGGIGAPYERGILLPVLFVAAMHPPRRIAAFLVLVALALAAPLIYGQPTAQEIGASAASLVIWIGLSVGVSQLMMGIRAQRLAYEREELEAREEARVDKLTGIHNRRAFDEALAQEARRARRLRVPLSVAMVDVVDFKQINDLWGPAEGDRCLREIAESLQASVREPDSCFRWGGDEFALIMLGTAAEDTEPLADRLRARVSSVCKRPDDEPVEIRFAVAELQEDEAPEKLVEIAGLAMNAAKLTTAV
jgi:diguanylate cyclase (GGDEF)-like protein